MASITFFDDAADFAATIAPLIDSDPVGATMVSHILTNHLSSPFPNAPLLVTVTTGDRVAAAALRTTPYPMILVVDPLATDPTELLDELAAAVSVRREPVVGVNGRRRTVELFAAAWAARTGSAAKPRMWELFYRLAELTEPAGVPGSVRPASMADPADVELLARWFCAFREETGVGRTPPVPDPDTVRRNVERGEVFLIWSVDGRAVATAGHSAVRHASSKIAPVYTPPEERRHGYGSAVTAAAVRSARQLGATEVTLFTDAEYEPSNLVYRRLGFEPIGEFAEFDFLESREPSA